MKTALIVGASGLVGSHLLQLLLNSAVYSNVISVVRKPSGIQNSKLDERIVDFDNLPQNLSADDVFCCLGTTMKQAGSKAAFEKVDLEYPIEIARILQKNGAKQYLLITAMGSDANSFFYYNRVKGQVENAIQKVGYETFLIFRPSMLLGNRNQNRIGEKIGQSFMKLIDFMTPKIYKAIDSAKVAKSMYETAQLKLKGAHIFASDKLQDF